MEDLAPILGIVISIAALIANAASKKQKMARKTTGSSSSNEENPTRPEPEPWTKRLEREWSEAMGLPQDVPTKHPEAEQRPAPKKRSHKATQPVIEPAKQENITDLESEKKMEETHDAVQSDITADFDLRKAILYSEIMKPKFEE